MFKRLLSALRGTAPEPAAATSRPAPAAPPAPEECIVAHDADGRELRIARDEWRDKVLLPNLQQKWHSADELYQLIISGVNDGFAAELVPAAARLVEIDGIPERSHVTQGIVLMKDGQLDAAEAALRAGIATVGASGILLTNLAKVLDERGGHAEAEETLWRAVQADPNQDNGMMWWVAIQRERDGDAGYLQALRTVAALPGSWRAQLWLARHHLEQGEVDAAKSLYAGVLAGAAFDGSALTMITGDLGTHGQVDLLAELVAPVYDESRHDPMTGLNLLRAWQMLGNVDEGERLLARMAALDIPPFRQYLDQFAQAFRSMREH